jgi:hypothetical protein
MGSSQSVHDNYYVRSVAFPVRMWLRMHHPCIGRIEMVTGDWTST